MLVQKILGGQPLLEEAPLPLLLLLLLLPPDAQKKNMKR